MTSFSLPMPRQMLTDAPIVVSTKAVSFCWSSSDTCSHCPCRAHTSSCSGEARQAWSETATRLQRWLPVA